MTTPKPPQPYIHTWARYRCSKCGTPLHPEHISKPENSFSILGFCTSCNAHHTALVNPLAHKGEKP
jgi:DNA-directed RNA polymerase subunit RPC12/RpoP